MAGVNEHSDNMQSHMKNLPGQLRFLETGDAPGWLPHAVVSDPPKNLRNNWNKDAGLHVADHSL